MLNEALRLLRVYHDLSQTELSLELGVSNSYLSEIESGKKQASLDILNKYSERFDVPLSSLFLFSEGLLDGRPTEKLRKFAAKKVIALLQWVEDKNTVKQISGRNGSPA